MSVAHPPAGLHRLPDAEYFAIDLPSSSGTKTLLNGTNAHLAAERETPREENEAFTLGAYLHALLLDPESIATNFIALGDIDRRTKEGKAEWESAQRRAGLSGARIITRPLIDQARAMAQAVRENPAAAQLLNTLSEREVTIIGEIGGRHAKAKVDGIIRLAGACIVLDVKTTESASPSDFAASAAKFAYFHQAAFYRRLVEQHIGVMDDFIIIAVEKKPPYLTAVYRIPSIAIETADARIDGLVRRWWDVAEGDRTGYEPSIQELEPPRWWLGND
jgi:exodeoxyribonuclease VIII